MNRSWMIGAALTGVVAVGACALKMNASENNSQLFTPARFSLVAADVDAAMLQSGGSGGSGGSRKVLFKLDSVTGEVWVLQLSIMGGNNPQVMGANWYPVKKAPVNPDPDANSQTLMGL